MKAYLATVCLSLTAVAEPVVVPDFSLKSIFTDDDVVQTDSVWVDDGATLEKTGTGKWTLPLGLIASPGPVDVAVRSGTIAIPSAAGEAPEPAKPLEVMNRAALWLDATYNVDATNGAENAKLVKDWRDVRETATALPYSYPHAVPRWVDPSADGVSGSLALPEVRERTSGMKNIYFHGYRSGACMRIAAANANGSDSANPIADIRHIFVVHGVFDTQGFVVSVERGSRIYHPGTTAGQVTDAILTPSGNNVPFLPNMGVWLNGRKIDPNLTVPAAGYQLLQLDYLSPLSESTARISAFYNDFNITPSINNEPSHIGGDDLCEVLVFTNTLTRSECIAVSKYLMHKWNLRTEGVRHLATTAQDAAVELENPSDASDEGRVSVAGVGTVSYKGSGAKAYFGHRNDGFAGTIAIDDGQSAVLGDDVYSIASRDGMQLMATNSFDGLLVSAKSAESGSISVTAHDSELTFKDIPQATRKLAVKTGTLRISPDASTGGLKTGAVSSVDIPNSGFEAAGENGNGWSSNRGSWKWQGDGGWCQVWSKNLYSQLQPEGKITWLSPFYAPEGNYVAAINGAGSLYSNVTIVEPGIYELSFLLHDSAHSRQKVTNKFQQSLQVIIADSDGANERLLGYAVGAYELGYVCVRYRTPELPAGEYRIVFRSPARSTSTDVTATIDDVRMQLVGREDSAIPVPNGDFERVSLPEGSLVYTISQENTADGWEFTQGNWGSSVADVPGVAVVRYSMRYPADDSKRAFPAKVQDFRTGMHQLAMMGSAGSASTTFNPPAVGLFRLRAAACRYRMTVNGKSFYSSNSDPDIEAKLTIGEETISLGCITGACQRLVDMEWPVAFELPATDISVTLTVSNRASNAAAILDDFVLVPLEDSSAKNAELIKNGTFTKNVRGWTVDKHGSDAYYQSESAYQFGYARCYDGENTPYGLVLVDRAGVYQDVVFPRPGRYRLRYHARGRVDYFEEEHKRDVFGYCRNVSVKAVLIEGDVTNILSTCYGTVSNFIARTVYLDVKDAPKTCTIGFETTNDPDVSGKKGQSVFVDGVSLKYCGPKAVAPAPDMSRELEVSVDEDAHLELDFQGCVTVGKVRIGGRSYSGVIDASRFPEYISGSGALKVIPKPTVIVIR